MTSPYPPAPRKLERSRENKMLGGVCAGVAKYLNVDPTLVRVLTVILCLFTGVGILAYLLMMLIVPEEPAKQWQPPQVPSPVPPASAQDPVWGAAGAPWEQPAASQPAQPNQFSWPQAPATPAAAAPFLPEPAPAEPAAEGAAAESEAPAEALAGEDTLEDAAPGEDAAGEETPGDGSRS